MSYWASVTKVSWGRFFFSRSKPIRKTIKKKEGCAILTEAQEYGVNGHIVHIKEQNGNCIRKYHHYLRRKKKGVRFIKIYWIKRNLLASYTTNDVESHTTSIQTSKLHHLTRFVERDVWQIISVDDPRLVLGLGMVANLSVNPEKQKEKFYIKKIEKSRILINTQASLYVYNTAGKKNQHWGENCNTLTPFCSLNKQAKNCTHFY